MKGAYANHRDCPNCDVPLIDCSTNFERRYSCGLCDYEERPTP